MSIACAELTMAEKAARMVDAGLSTLEDMDAPDRLALAWAMKDLCYAAWSSEPQRAASAADAIGQLVQTVDAGASGAAIEIQALADWTAGIAHVTRGRMADAVRSFDEAAVRFRSLRLDDAAAQTQVPKIMALSMQGLYAAAAECAEHAQQAFVALGNVRAAGKVTLNLGALNHRRGEFASAARAARAASVLFARIGDHEHSVMADINLGNALTSLGDFDEALRIYARARMRAVTHAFPVLETMADEWVALLQLARGCYPEALEGLEGARRRYEQLGMPQHLAIAEKELADAYLELRLLPEALALFDQASARFEALNIPDEQAWTLVQRGRALTLLDQTDAASTAFELAHALFTSQGNRVGESAVALARAELTLARGEAGAASALAVHAARGFADAGLANGQLRADVVRASALLQAGHVEPARDVFTATLQRARDLHLVTVQVRSLTGLGQAAQAVGGAAAARRAFEAAIELFEDQRQALPGDEFRCSFLTDHLRPYQELLRLALEAHEAEPSSAEAAKVLLQLDRFRARSLDDSVARRDDPRHDATSPALRERLNWLYRRVQRLDDEGESSSAFDAELRRTELELLERARRHRIAGQSRSIGAAEHDPFSLPALQASLSDDGALLAYGVLDDELFACVVTGADVQLIRRIASWREVRAALLAAQFQIDTLRHGAAPLQQHLQSLTARAETRMARLYAPLWAPLAAALDASRRVLVVPHGELGALPFAALREGEACLAERHCLAMVPSARLALRGLQTQPVRSHRILALAESSRLPHVAREAELVTALFVEGEAFVGTQATLAKLQLHASRADVIHLACHAQFRSDNPRFSALHLYDGALTVELAEGLRLRHGCLVVLSACETGLSEAGNGNETVGLVRAFLVAGAARVLASQWPVDDAVTALFMAAFYAALSRGAVPAEALRLAQARVRASHPHPFHWAAFVLYGGW